MEPVAIRPEFGKALFDVEREFETGGRGELSLGLYRFGDRRLRSDPVSLDGEAVGLDTGHVEKILDQAIHLGASRVRSNPPAFERAAPERLVFAARETPRRGWSRVDS